MDGRRGITGPPLDQPDGMIVNETEHHHMKIRSVGIDLGKTTFHLVARVSFFMNRFRDLGFINYDGGGMHVHSSLVSVGTP
jgi:hypothetical protein